MLGAESFAAALGAAGLVCKCAALIDDTRHKVSSDRPRLPWSALCGGGSSCYRSWLSMLGAVLGLVVLALCL